MSVTAAQVKELRVKTGAGMMDCKKALTETGGDFEKAVEQLRKAGLAATNKKAGRIATEGLVGSYIHGNGKIGVMVEINCETDFVARNEDFQQFVKDVAMHVAAMNPQFLDRDSVPADTVTKEKEILAAQIADEGKPANIVEKIVEGRIGKFFAENCLMEQVFVKDTGDKKTLEAIQTDLIAKIGEKISVRRFVRFELGEGMEKKNEDFAAEVAKTAGQAN